MRNEADDKSNIECKDGKNNSNHNVKISNYQPAMTNDVIGRK